VASPRCIRTGGKDNPCENGTATVPAASRRGFPRIERHDERRWTITKRRVLHERHARLGATTGGSRSERRPRLGSIWHGRLLLLRGSRFARAAALLGVAFPHQQEPSGRTRRGGDHHVVPACYRRRRAALSPASQRHCHQWRSPVQDTALHCHLWHRLPRGGSGRR
jgi:hypothetical protein